MTIEYQQPGYNPPHFTIVDFSIEAPDLLVPILPYATAEAGLSWMESRSTSNKVKLAFGKGQVRDVHQVITWTPAQGIHAATRLLTGRLREMEKQQVVSYGESTSRQRQIATQWGNLSVLNHQAALSWINRISTAEQATNVSYGDLRPEDKHWHVENWHVHFEKVSYKKPVYQVPKQDEVNFSLEVGNGAQHISFHHFEQRQPLSIEQASRVLWGSMSKAQLATEIPWQEGVRLPPKDWGNPYEPTPLEPRPEPVQPDHNQSVQIMNSLQILSMPEGLPIHGSVQLSQDVDSYCWTASLTVQGKHQLAALRPTSEGPRELQITLNGYVFKLFIEKVNKRGQFPSETYSVTAHSYHRQFGKPWAPQLSASLTADTSALQLMDLLIANTGFSIERPIFAEWVQTPDWTIEAGSYSYADKAPIEVMQELCEAVGAVLVPHPNELKWTLQPRYLVNPWALDEAPSTAFSHIIPASLNLDWQSESAPGQAHNGVLISGINYGVACDVTRTGTAGDNRQADIYNDLHQSIQQCTERGRNELAKAGSKELMTIDLPLMPTGSAPELVLPGALAKYENPIDTSANFKGVVLSVAISTTSAASIRQQVTIEVDNGNN